MGSVTFIVGYCGSGKSHRAKQLERERGLRRFDEGFLKDPNQHAQLIQSLRSGVSCVVVEIHYCLEARRSDIIRELQGALPGVNIEWIYFQADLAKANTNCRRRTNKNDPGGLQHVRINDCIGSMYKIPDGVTPLPIFEIPDPELT